MAFVKNPDRIEVGDIAVLNSDVSSVRGTITRGSRVKVIGWSFRGPDIQDLETGECVYECMGTSLRRE